MILHSNQTLPVSEQFLSIQGEGRTLGTPAYFLRLNSGDIAAKYRPKSKYIRWRYEPIEGKQKTFAEIITNFGPNFLRNIDALTHHLVILGHEPLLHQEVIVELLDWLSNDCAVKMIVEIETNGAVTPIDNLFRHVTHWNISPKLSNSGVHVIDRINGEAILKLTNKMFANSVCFKFIVSGQKDITEAIKSYILPFNIPEINVYLIPASDNEYNLRQLSKKIIPVCIQKGMKFSTRLYIAVYEQ